MSHCPHCWVMQCKKHKLQDHGRREKELKAKAGATSEKLKQFYDNIVGSQLSKIEAFEVGTGDEENQRHREKMDRHRADLEKQKNKFSKKKQEKARQLAALNGSVAQFMLNVSEGSDLSETSDDERRKRKKKKKDKKKKKEKRKKKGEKRKSNKKEKRPKKRKKSKKTKKRKHQSSSSSSSTSDSDSSSLSDDDSVMDKEWSFQKKRRREHSRAMEQSKEDKNSLDKIVDESDAFGESHGNDDKNENALITDEDREEELRSAVLKTLSNKDIIC